MENNSGCPSLMNKYRKNAIYPYNVILSHIKRQAGNEREGRIIYATTCNFCVCGDGAQAIWPSGGLSRFHWPRCSLARCHFIITPVLPPPIHSHFCASQLWAWDLTRSVQVKMASVSQSDFSHACYRTWVCPHAHLSSL